VFACACVCAHVRACLHAYMRAYNRIDANPGIPDLWIVCVYISDLWIVYIYASIYLSTYPITYIHTYVFLYICIVYIYIRFENVFGCRIRRKSALRSRIFFASTEVLHTLRSDFPLYFDIKDTYQIRTEKKMLEFGVCFTQACSSDGCRFAASTSRLNYYRTIGLFPKRRIR